jgi:hypothetical protein
MKTANLPGSKNLSFNKICFMSKAFQLTIPKPCHESWDKMTATDKGKFCDSCQKQVTDFTGMSDRELIAFFRKPTTGSVCGRFQNDQLNHELEIPKKRIPWLKYFFQFALPAFLASSKATAQDNVKILTGDTVVVNTTQIRMGRTTLKCKLPPVSKTITGKVVDQKGYPIPYASIMIRGTKTGTSADMEGNFKITLPNLDSNISIIASAVGFEPRECNLSNSLSITIVLVELKMIDFVGLIVTVPKKQETIPLLQRIFKDTAFKNFKFYPNPAAPGSNITIEWKKPEAGDFEIQLLNQNGQLIPRQEINHEKETRSLQFNVPAVAAGTYFLLLTNRKSGKKITEKIIIQ